MVTCAAYMAKQTMAPVLTTLYSLASSNVFKVRRRLAVLMVLKAMEEEKGVVLLSSASNGYDLWLLKLKHLL